MRTTEELFADAKARYMDKMRKIKREELDGLDSSNNIHATAHETVQTPAPSLVARQPVQQPRSRPPAKHAPMQIGGSQPQHEENDDSLVCIELDCRASSNDRLHSDQHGRHLERDDELKGDAKLVLRREEVFAAQRKARDESLLQDLSRERVETAFGPVAGAKGPYHSGYRHYVKFCSRIDVPPFPITYAMMALWLYEKCSTRDGYFQTYKQGVGLAADYAEPVWTNHPVFDTMRRFDRDGTALSAFLEERRLAHKSAAAKTSPKSKAKAASQAAYEQRRKALDEWQDLDAFGDSDASSASDEGSEYGGESDMGNGGRAEVRGLPTCDSVYDSLVKIYKVYVAALVPVYGISVMVLTPTHGSVPIKCNRNKPRYVNLPGGACPWVAFCRRRHDGKWIVDFDVSTFEHSHGPCKEILADPTWRPTVHNADARAVLGMPPLHKQSTHKRQTFSEPKQDQPPRKKARLSATPSSASMMPPPPVPTRPPTSIPARPRPPSLPAAPHWSPSAQPSYPSPVSPQAPQTHASCGAEVSGFNQSVSAIAASSSSGPRNPSPLATWTRMDPPPPTQPSSRSPVLAATKAVASGSPSATTDPLELVSAFCAGLHPSLTTLAGPLVAAGVGSPEGLVALRVFEPYRFDQFLTHLRKNHSERRAKLPSLPPLSNVHLLLFAKHMKA
ncbi:hypothetical protein B0A53_06126 [Rhodotorula sp. CCFEE 5036]|nr:hypothetical protein B0A53_06126 [Rhodotorula sp. CCFEE 5036]